MQSIKNHVLTNKRKNGKHIVQAVHQVEQSRHNQQVTTNVMTPSPNVNALTNQSQIKYIVDSDSMKSVQSITLRFQVRANGGSIHLAPTPYWWDRIEFYNRHTGDEICRVYNDALFVMLNLVDQDQLEQWDNLVNYDASSFTESKSYTREQASGTTRYYYLCFNCIFCSFRYSEIVVKCWRAKISVGAIRQA